MCSCPLPPASQPNSFPSRCSHRRRLQDRLHPSGHRRPRVPGRAAAGHPGAGGLLKGGSWDHRGPERNPASTASLGRCDCCPPHFYRCTICSFRPRMHACIMYTTLNHQPRTHPVSAAQCCTRPLNFRDRPPELLLNLLAHPLPLPHACMMPSICSLVDCKAALCASPCKLSAGSPCLQHIFMRRQTPKAHQSRPPNLSSSIAAAACGPSAAPAACARCSSSSTLLKGR